MAAIWSERILTDAGAYALDLYNAGVTDLRITRVVATNTFTPPDALQGLTTPAGRIFELRMLGNPVTIPMKGTTIKVQWNNEYIDSEYVHRQLLILAKHPQVNEGEEFVYYALQAELGTEDRIPPGITVGIVLTYGIVIKHVGVREVIIEIDWNAEYIPAEWIGIPGGIAPLDQDGKISNKYIKYIREGNAGDLADLMREAEEGYFHLITNETATYKKITLYDIFSGKIIYPKTTSDQVLTSLSPEKTLDTTLSEIGTRIGAVETRASSLESRMSAAESRASTYRTIDGINYNHSANVLRYTTSSTAAGTAAKVASVTNFVLATGARCTVRFNNTNTNLTPTLNVTATGAYPIQLMGEAFSDLEANGVYDFIYTGSTYEVIGGGGGGGILVSAAAPVSKPSNKSKLWVRTSDGSAHYWDGSNWIAIKSLWA